MVVSKIIREGKFDEDGARWMFVAVSTKIKGFTIKKSGFLYPDEDNEVAEGSEVPVEAFHESK